MNLLTVMGIMFFAQMSPGPDMTLLLRYILNNGKKHSILCVLGITCGLAFHISVVTLGLYSILQKNPAIFEYVKLIGGIYLAYLGVGGLLANSSKSEGESVKKSLDYFNSFKDGLLCNLLNPKATMFIFALFSTLASENTEGSTIYFYAVVLLFQAFIIWSLFVLLVGSKRVVGKLKRIETYIEKVLCLILIGLGGASIYEAFRSLL